MTNALINQERADELLRRQDALQAEAADVLADLDLFNLLSSVGEVTQVGSSATGLMAWRDIDICVVCDVWNADAAFEAGRPLASHPRVKKLDFLNEAGHFKPPGLAEGYYWGVRYHTSAGDEWKLDIWFWPRGATAYDVEYAEELRRRLTPETRVAILWIKDAHHRLHAYGAQEVRSIDIYDAVLEHGVRTPAMFDGYLAERHKPAPDG